MPLALSCSLRQRAAAVSFGTADVFDRATERIPVTYFWNFCAFVPLSLRPLSHF